MKDVRIYTGKEVFAESLAHYLKETHSKSYEAEVRPVPYRLYEVWVKYEHFDLEMQFLSDAFIAGWEAGYDAF